MSEQKIFIGHRLKRLRANLGLSQVAMAQGLDISASYLNLIERNQRPLTVQLMMRLSSVYNIAPDALSGDSSGTISALKTVFADRLLEGELPSYEELFEIADAAPNVANGILKLHEGYRRCLDQLSELNQHLAQSNPSDVTRAGSITERVHNEMADRPNYYAPIEQASAALYEQLNIDQGMWGALQTHLLQQHHIRVQFLPNDVMPDHIRRFDKHSMRLFLSDRLSWPERQFELAKQVAQLELQQAIHDSARRLPLSQDVAQDYARQCLVSYAALALLLPYQRFFQTAQRLKFDLLTLSDRFGLKPRLIARRFSTLADTKMAGPAWFLIETNAAAQALLYLSAKRFDKHSLNHDCARLNLFRALRRAGELQCDLIETESNQRFASLAYFDGHRASLLFLAQDQLEQTVYADLASREPIKTGVNCRLCERAHCEFRSAAPLIHPPSLQDHQRSVAPFDFDS